MIVKGGLVNVYPNPILVIVVDVTAPFVTTAVAAAVVPTPTGGANLMSTFPDYPEPALVIVIALIVPAADTVAVTEAPTFIAPDEISASTLLSPD